MQTNKEQLIAALRPTFPTMLVEDILLVLTTFPDLSCFALALPEHEIFDTKETELQFCSNVGEVSNLSDLQANAEQFCNSFLASMHSVLNCSPKSPCYSCTAKAKR